MRGPRRYKTAKDKDPLEKVIQRGIVGYAVREYPKKLEVRKFSQGNSRFKTGDPDLLFFPLRPLIPFLMELKRRGEQPTEAQAERIKRYRDLGYHTYVVDTVEEGQQIIDFEMAGGWTPLKEKIVKNIEAPNKYLKAVAGRRRK